MSCKITIVEKKRLEKKAKIGWAMYYNELEETHCLIQQNYELVKKLNNLNANTENQKLPSNLVDEIRELYDVMKRKVECPICYEEMESNDFIISACNCKVKYCKDCYDKLNECAMCKWKYKRNK
jgi:hypothetical protein